MVEKERKNLVWDIRKNLLYLSPNELFQITEQIGAFPCRDPSELFSGDAEGCFEYISNFMYSKDLTESEDMGMRKLLGLKDVIDDIVQPGGDDILPVDSNVNAQSVSIPVTSPSVELGQVVTANVTSPAAVSTAATTTSTSVANTAVAATLNHAKVLPDSVQQMLLSYEDFSKKLL